jgi:hypothetical protein
VVGQFPEILRTGTTDLPLYLSYIHAIRSKCQGENVFFVITAGRKMGQVLQVLESMKSQTPSTKLQTNLKFQYQMTKTGLEFSVTVADCRKREKSIEAPSEGSSKLGSLGLESFLPVLSD